MRVTLTALPDVLVIEPDVHRDARGFFLETYRAETYQAHGVPGIFVQDNQSCSLHGTVRGLHLQTRRPQGKLIRVLEGEIFDVAVDVRRGSPTFSRWVGVTLSADNFRQCYMPPGFAHGFAVTSARAQVEYKCTDVYDPGSEVGIAWNDPTIGISWPVERPLLSDRDRGNPRMAAMMDRLPEYLKASLASVTDL
jgi:dTDP-4-dehydrorhamnose 3,5-epimerase